MSGIDNLNKIPKTSCHEEQFFTTFKMGPSSTALTKMDGTYVNVNERYCNSTGFTKEELIGTTGEAIGLCNKETFNSILGAILENGQVNNVEIWFYRKDGTRVCSFISARVISIENENYILLIAQDISQYKKIIQELKLSEDKFLELFYLSPDAIIISRLDGTYVEVNREFVRMTGYSAEEVIGKNALDLGIWYNPLDREHMIREQQKCGKLHGLELTFKRKNGNIALGQLSVGRFHFNGEPCLMVIIRDITHQRQIEKLKLQHEAALADSNNKLSIAASLANLGPWEYTPDTEFFTFGDEFYKIYATSLTREGPQMSYDKYMKTFVHPDDIWMLSDEKSILASGEQVEDIVHRIIRRDGEIRTIMVRRIAVKDDTGRIVKIYGTNQDITERIKIEEERSRQEEAIVHMAYFDSLTDLANRRHLNERLTLELKRSCKGESCGTVLFIDLDDLKLINDTYGHTYGDKIIVETGLRIVNILGEKVFVARVGGDEFVVILSCVKEHNEIENIVRSLRDELGNTLEFFGLQFHISASIGIASYPADGNTVEEIIKNADNAMYAAKRSGKNCWRYYTETMQDEAYKEIRLTNSLRYALESNELLLMFQPQFDALRKRVVGLEALLRWKSKEHGLVPPLQFIPLAEQSGLIHNIGQWVLREACSFAKSIANKGFGDVRVAVNISAKQIANDEFIDIVRNAIEETGIKANQLELEITESSLMTSLEEAMGKLIQLKDLGVHLSLDDFGTGFSSLTYLMNLPVETLKIDKSFIDMITTDIQGAKIISSVIGMAHAINMRVVAEGVENKYQLAYLTDNHCDCIQGYLFSPPIPKVEAINLLALQNTVLP